MNDQEDGPANPAQPRAPTPTASASQPQTGQDPNQSGTPTPPPPKPPSWLFFIPVTIWMMVLGAAVFPVIVGLIERDARALTDAEKRTDALLGIAPCLLSECVQIRQAIQLYDRTEPPGQKQPPTTPDANGPRGDKQQATAPTADPPSAERRPVPNPPTQPTQPISPQTADTPADPARGPISPLGAGLCHMPRSQITANPGEFPIQLMTEDLARLTAPNVTPMQIMHAHRDCLIQRYMHLGRTIGVIWQATEALSDTITCGLSGACMRQMSNNTLTFLLVILLGGLGGVAVLFQGLLMQGDVFKTQAGAGYLHARRLRWYIARPAQGMVMAFIVYLGVRAGQLMVSANGATVGDLNPFLVGFIAVVAGLRSTAAFKAIEKAGGRILGVQQNQPNPLPPTTERRPDRRPANQQGNDTPAGGG